MNIVILVLGLLTAFGPLSIDMYLPALPGIARDFNASLSAVQLSLASYFVGIASGQIIYGPITDRFGRKKPLYVGLILYGIASFFCATTSEVDHLIFFRFLQALGSCAGIVISRAMVRDLFKPQETAKVFSTLMLIMGVAPILAPLLGGFLTTAFGWRSIFWLLTGVSAMALLAVRIYLPETFTAHPDHRLSRALHNYVGVLRDRQFVAYTFSLSFIYAGMFAYITGSSFVFIEYFHLSPTFYSWIFGFNAFGFILFSQVNTRLLRKYSSEELIRKTLPCTFFAGVLLFVTSFFQVPVWVFCVPLFIFILTLGLIAPNSSACALAHQKKSAGSASALMGTIQFTVSALCSTLVSRLHDGSILPMTLVMFGCSAIALCLYWLLVLRAKDMPPVAVADH